MPTLQQTAVLVLALLLLVGCTPPGTGLTGVDRPVTVPAPVVTPAAGDAGPVAGPAPPVPPAEAAGPSGSPLLPPAPTAPNLATTDGQVAALGLAVVRRPYLWSPDGTRVAFQDQGGLWALSPDGAVAEPVAAGAKHRELVGWTAAAGLVYLEARPEGTAVVAGKPGQASRDLAMLTADQVGTPGQPLWYHLAGSRLVVAAEGLPVWQVDAATGRFQKLSGTPLPVHYGACAVSPDDRIVACKQSNRGDPVRLLDLETGALLTPAREESHLPGLEWSPMPSGGATSTGNLWAVRAAAPGSGLPVAVGANMGEGAGHVTVGDATGQVRRLLPPEPLQLVSGPYWSPDGRWLAVTAGVVRGMQAGQPAEFRATSVWLVEVESGRWRRLGDVAAFWGVGWHPDGQDLLVQMDGSRVERWPVATGAAGAAPHPWQPRTAAALPGGGYVYLSLGPAPRLVLERPGQDPAVVVSGAGHKSDLTVHGATAALVVWPDGDRPRLVLARLP